jgi:hypothetical protein
MSTEPLASQAVAEGESPELRYDWTRAAVEAIYRTPVPELVFRAQAVHRQFQHRTVCRLANCFPLRPVGARRIVRIARRARTTTRPWIGKVCLIRSMW